MPKYDIHIQPVERENVFGYKCFGFGYAAPLKVSGFQSLINRWVKTFLTPRGSDLLYPSHGTEFGLLPGSNLDSRDAEVRSVVEMAVADANEQVRAQDLEAMKSSDTQLHSAEVLDYVEAADMIEVWILIENEAGESLAVRAGVLGEG